MINSTIMGVCLIIIGALWICFGLINKTKNFSSALLYRIFPFLSGLTALFCGLIALGFVIQLP